MQKRKKRYTLVYRRAYPFDTRAYNENKFIRDPLSTIAINCPPDDDTFSRIRPIRKGRFVYVPSAEYLERKKSGIWLRDPLKE